MRRSTAAVLLVLFASPTIAQAQVKKEPPLGALQPGQVVLVDDGTCPAGQIKRVVGGDHKKVGGKNLVERRRSCVSR